MNVSTDEVVQRLREELTADMADLFDEHHHLRPVVEWPVVWRRGLVTHFERAQLELLDERPFLLRTRIGLADRTQLVKLLGRHLGVWE